MSDSNHPAPQETENFHVLPPKGRGREHPPTPVQNHPRDGQAVRNGDAGRAVRDPAADGLRLPEQEDQSAHIARRAVGAPGSQGS